MARDPEGWRSIFHDAPDWQDSNTTIEVRTAAGVISKAKLTIDDVFGDGADEVPIWKITLEDGSTPSLFDFEYWR